MDLGFLSNIGTWTTAAGTGALIWAVNKAIRMFLLKKLTGLSREATVKKAYQIAEKAEQKATEFDIPILDESTEEALEERAITTFGDAQIGGVCAAFEYDPKKLVKLLAEQGKNLYWDNPQSKAKYLNS